MHIYTEFFYVFPFAFLIDSISYSVKIGQFFQLKALCVFPLT